MMRFALLASGSKGNCFLFWDEALFLMIDCGTTKKYLKESFQKVHADPADLDAVLITHDHSDHIAQLGMFSDHVIYSPVELGIPIQKVTAGQAFQIQHVTITPIALSHDAPNTTGYILSTWQEKLVYITDTGYIADRYLPLLKGADYVILESNHDVQMLMETRRPQYLKMRIAGDEGHLNNEDAAQVVNQIATEKTKMIVLAHISQQANTREKALEVTREVLVKEHAGMLNHDLILSAAGQHEIVLGGEWTDEKVDGGTVSCTPGMERMAYLENLTSGRTA